MITASASEISFFIGDVSLIRNNKSVNIDTGIKLQTGDIIHTGAGAEAQVAYDDGTMVRLQEKTTVRIGCSGVVGSDDVSVSRGSVSAKFSKIKKGERKVSGPSMICAVRGTEFSFTVSKNGDSRVDLSEGSVENRNPYGTRNIAPGESTETSIGKQPSAGKGDVAAWRSSSDETYEKNPDRTADSYKGYVRSFDKRSKDSSSKMKKLSARTKKMSKDTAAGTEEEINKTEAEILDDYMLNESAGDALGEILQDFKDRKKEMYDKFQSVKEESNRVRDVQRQNYEALQAIRDEYRKNYDQIKGSYKDEKSKIKDSGKGIDTKPKFVEE